MVFESLTLTFNLLKVYLYRTWLGGVREGMVQIKQTKVVYTERESERGTHFNLFYLDQCRKPRSV